MDRNLNKDLMVSIILSESTTSLLNLTLPSIEEFAETSGNTCILKTLNQSDIQVKERLLSYFFVKQQEQGKESREVDTSIAYFSSTYQSESNSSLNPTDAEPIEMRQRIMEEKRVYTRPLLAANTIAHENKIFMEDNNIYIQIVNDELKLADSDIICRICHGGESLGDLLSPCRCKGTIALTHVECLERWLKESSNSYCELCKHHFQIVRQPKYSIPWSVLIYLSNPGNNLRDILMDLIAFIIYTPSALASTYMLMLICESVTKSQMHRTRNISAHIITFCAVFGMAAIDFTYSSWLIVTFQRHASAWRTWYRNNSFLKLQLPEWKRKTYRHKHDNLSNIEN